MNSFYEVIGRIRIRVNIILDPDSSLHGLGSGSESVPPLPLSLSPSTPGNQSPDDGCDCSVCEGGEGLAKMYNLDRATHVASS